MDVVEECDSGNDSDNGSFHEEHDPLALEHEDVLEEYEVYDGGDEDEDEDEDKGEEEEEEGSTMDMGMDGSKGS